MGSGAVGGTTSPARRSLRESAIGPSGKLMTPGIEAATVHSTRVHHRDHGGLCLRGRGVGVAVSRAGRTGTPCVADSAWMSASETDTVSRLADCAHHSCRYNALEHSRPVTKGETVGSPMASMIAPVVPGSGRAANRIPHPHPSLLPQSLPLQPAPVHP